MHGPWLGPHCGQRSPEEDIPPGRGRHALSCVKTNKVSPSACKPPPIVQVHDFWSVAACGPRLPAACSALP